MSGPLIWVEPAIALSSLVCIIVATAIRARISVVIALVSVGVACSEVFSSSRSAMSVWRENSPTTLGPQDVFVFSLPTTLARKSGFCKSTTLTSQIFSP